MALVHPNVHIGPYSVIGPGVRIGPHTIIGAHCTIGGPPEHRDHYKSWNFSVRIGSCCFISNNVTIDSGCERDTEIQDGTWMLRGSHAGHDSIIMHDSTVSCSVLVGGFAVVMPYANCGLSSIIHQHMVIGPLAMLGMGTIVTKKTPIEPCNIYTGSPAKLLKRNDHGVEKSGLSDEAIRDLKYQYYIRVAK